MQITLDLPSNLELELAAAAKQRRLSLNEYIIQCLLQTSSLKKIPNQATQKIINDARSGKNMQRISLDELKEML